MTRADTEGGLYPALLKYWRRRKGLSQLDLALAAGVSARHVSFLETGRAQPSRPMILRLGATLGVPLRDQNGMLRAAGCDPEFAEPGLKDGLPPIVLATLERMLAQQEPYPLLIMNRRYELLRGNTAATRLIAALLPDLSEQAAPLNLLLLLFTTLRAAVADWEAVARTLLWRLHREALERPGDAALADLLRTVHALPDVPEDWRHPDLSASSDPALCLRLRAGDGELAFLTTVTAFSAPQSVTLEELRIESYFPADDATAAACRAMAGDPAG
ncbi:MAG: helix-turn-helix transcriptional regulator [Myxococcales bacterium]|nr:helix-turn-helix transcriptional regulator [Myxococcales bacterium]